MMLRKYINRLVCRTVKPQLTRLSDEELENMVVDAASARASAVREA